MIQGVIQKDAQYVCKIHLKYLQRYAKELFIFSTALMADSITHPKISRIQLSRRGEYLTSELGLYKLLTLLCNSINTEC